MNINVPEHARAHFWEEPPPDTMEFWSFRFSPLCTVGDPLLFRFDRRIVAEAVVARIEQPGQSACEATRRFRQGYKVFWEPTSFVDRRAR